MTGRILVDTSAWLWHVRFGDPVVDRLAQSATIVGHVDVAGELAMGQPPRSVSLRDEVLALPRLPSMEDEQLLRAVTEWELAGSGVGWIDAALLAACREFLPEVTLYTRDRRMRDAARRIGIPVLDPPAK